MEYPPELKSLVEEAKATTCIEYAQRHDWKLKRSGMNYSGPCPNCGGTDRFAIDARGNKWFCRAEGVGGHDAISMVISLDSQGLSGSTYGEMFIPACERITGRSRRDEVSQAELDRRKDELRKKKEDQDRIAARCRDQSRKAAWDIWRAGRKTYDSVAGYMIRRGLKVNPHDLYNVGSRGLYSAIREVPNLPYWHNGEKIHEGPAMVLCIQGLDGRFCGVHMTWIDLSPDLPKGRPALSHDGNSLPTKKIRGSKGNGAVRIYTPANPKKLVIGEGFETTLTAMACAYEPNTAYWMGIDLGHMSGRCARDEETGKRLPHIPDMRDEKCLIVPKWCEDLTLIMDGDSNKKTTLDALRRGAARQMNIRPNLKAYFAHPGDGKDLNDIVMSNENEGEGDGVE